MADLTLHDGRTITLDMNRITIREYRALFDNKQDLDAENETLAKAFGIGVDEFLDLSQPDFKRATALFFETARAPLDDPKV